MLSDKDRDTLLIRMDERLKGIESSLERQYKCIHGNGQPGLLSRVQTLEDLHQNENSFMKKFGGIIGWIATTAIALYSVFKHHS